MNSYDKIYEIVRKIPEGKVSTYGQIAFLAGNPRWSRVVGYALHVNPFPWEQVQGEKAVPCHRVVNRFGEPSSAFAFGGVNKQIELLEEEDFGHCDVVVAVTKAKHGSVNGQLNVRFTEIITGKLPVGQ